ncbi:hypothetical protein ACWGH2_24535 [Streptomyces sp. NPDC054871]
MGRPTTLGVDARDERQVAYADIQALVEASCEHGRSDSTLGQMRDTLTEVQSALQRAQLHAGPDAGDRRAQALHWHVARLMLDHVRTVWPTAGGH